MRAINLIFLLLLLFCGSEAIAQLKPFYSAASQHYGYKDAGGKVLVEPRYELAYSFVEGRAAIKRNGKYGYLDESGREIVVPKYDFTWHFIGGYAAVRVGDLYGFIDQLGKEVIPPRYEDANNYHGNCCYKGMAHVKEKGVWKIVKL